MKPIHLPDAPHAFLPVQSRTRWLVLRHGDGRLEDLGFCTVQDLLPYTGTIGGTPEDSSGPNPSVMVNGLRWRSPDGTRSGHALMPRDAPTDSVPAHESGAPVTLLFDSQARLAALGN